MSSNSIGQIAVGVVGGIVGFLIGGPVGAMYGFSLGAIAGGLLFPPEQDSGDLRPDEVQFTNSTEAQTCPVIFGTVRIPGNHVGFNPETFRVVELTAEPQGGKGGGEEQVTGFNYFLTYAVGLCMGEVDALVRVQGSPGEDNVLWKEERQILEISITFDESAGTITSNDGDQFSDFAVGQDIQITGAVDEANNGEFRIVTVTATVLTVVPGSINSDETFDAEVLGTTYQAPVEFSGATISSTFTGREDRGDRGSVILYPGTMDQTNPDPDGDNHRGICFAYFDDFNMGGSSAPRSYLFTLRRMPKPRDSSGNLLLGISARAADNDTFPEFEDANPAAVVWEIFTQGFEDGVTNEAQWGKGMSPDKMNQEDFETASDYYRTNRIGISTSLGGGSGGLRELLSKLRDLFGLWVWWDGEQLRCRVFWDRENAYEPRNRITEEDIVGEVKFARPSQASTANEIRLEFSNRRNNFQKEAITLQDLGHAETVGAIRSESLMSKEVGTRRAAHLLASRMLRSFAYPTATCKINVQRNFAHLQPGDFVELVWNTWRSGAVTSFWRVLSLEDDETSDNSVAIILQEDQFATARDGEITDFTLPIVSVDVDVPLDDGDFGLINYAATGAIGDISPVLIDEPSIWITKGTRRVVVGATRRVGGLQSLSVGWSEDPFVSYTSLGAAASFPVTGTLSGLLSATSKMIRNTRADDHFDLALSVSGDDTRLLAAASLVGDENDDFSLLTATQEAILLIGSEVIRVGLIDEDVAGVFTVKNAIRGEYGSDIQEHADGAEFFFFPVFDYASQTIQASTLPIDVVAKARIQGFTGRASSDPVIVDGPDSNTWNGRSIDPLPFTLLSASKIGTVWTVTVRPRIHTGGANFGPTFETEAQSREPTLGEILARIETNLGDSVLLSSFYASGSEADGDLDVTSANYIPSDGTNAGTTGLISFELTFTVNPASVEIFANLNGRNSDPLTIPQP